MLFCPVPLKSNSAPIQVFLTPKLSYIWTLKSSQTICNLFRVYLNTETQRSGLKESRGWWDQQDEGPKIPASWHSSLLSMATRSCRTPAGSCWAPDPTRAQQKAVTERARSAPAPVWQLWIPASTSLSYITWPCRTKLNRLGQEFPEAALKQVTPQTSPELTASPESWTVPVRSHD